MATTTLTGSNQTLPLGGGYALRAPGLRGTAELQQPGLGTTRSRVPALGDGLAALEAALAAANVTEVREIELNVQPAAVVAGAGALRSVQGEAAIELHVPDLGAEVGQLVLSVDDAGALRWHLPLEHDAQTVQPSSVRGAGDVKRFRIPATLAAPAAGTAQTQRSVFGAVARRLLKVLVYPVTDPLLGAVGEFFAERWEDKKRPYGLRSFTPQNFRDPNVPALSASELSTLTQGGPALLFIHGTFSTAHAAFGELFEATLEALHHRYGARVFAFNHHSLSHDPKRNVAWLLSQLPAGAIELDLISHSRGGLVARTLAEAPAGFELDATRVKVRRVVFAGVPNGGTPLAHPDHMVNLIDRLTTVLTLSPTGPVTETIEALVTVLKVVGHAALNGLPGLASMKPQGEFLSLLNVAGPAAPQYFAVASNYEPTDRGLHALVAGAADNVADQIFGQVGNDLVVPTDGVSASNGHTGFPLLADRLLVLKPIEGVTHTAMFGHPAVNAKLLEWLS